LIKENLRKRCILEKNTSLIDDGYDEIAQNNFFFIERTLCLKKDTPSDKGIFDFKLLSPHPASHQPHPVPSSLIQLLVIFD
jgi:hypothetical protein